MVDPASAHAVEAARWRGGLVAAAARHLLLRRDPGDDRVAGRRCGHAGAAAVVAGRPAGAVRARRAGTGGRARLAPPGGLRRRAVRAAPARRRPRRAADDAVPVHHHGARHDAVHAASPWARPACTSGSSSTRRPTAWSGRCCTRGPATRPAASAVDPATFYDFGETYVQSLVRRGVHATTFQNALYAASPFSQYALAGADVVPFMGRRRCAPAGGRGRARVRVRLPRRRRHRLPRGRARLGRGDGRDARRRSRRSSSS